LRYYDEKIYSYSFDFESLFRLNTDGSYSWNNTGQNFEYGENQLVFDEAELKTKEHYRIVNDGESNAEYYIDGKKVTQKEILKYIENNAKLVIEFSPLEISWLNKISRHEAITIAENYWETLDIDESGYHIEHGINSQAPASVYVIIIQRLVSDYHYSTFDEIWVDKNTGETIIPYAPDKG
jgi:hypothetical protein